MLLRKKPSLPATQPADLCCGPGAATASLPGLARAHNQGPGEWARRASGEGFFLLVSLLNGGDTNRRGVYRRAARRRQLPSGHARRRRRKKSRRTRRRSKWLRLPPLPARSRVTTRKTNKDLFSCKCLSMRIERN